MKSRSESRPELFLALSMAWKASSAVPNSAVMNDLGGAGNLEDGGGMRKYAKMRMLPISMCIYICVCIYIYMYTNIFVS